MDLHKFLDWVEAVFKIALIILVGLMLLLMAQYANAYTSYQDNSYLFPAEQITMDVSTSSSSMGGGTYRCPSVQACYIRVLEAEARGATYFCNSIVIKRDGVPVWTRRYR